MTECKQIVKNELNILINEMKNKIGKNIEISVISQSITTSINSKIVSVQHDISHIVIKLENGAEISIREDDIYHVFFGDIDERYNSRSVSLKLENYQDFILEYET